MGTVQELFPAELRDRIASGEQVLILDVREPEEIAIAPFQRAVHIPMGDVPARISELDPEQPTVVICHHGIRSAQVAGYLSRMGFEQVFNLAGGVDAWSASVDPTVPRY